MEIIYILTGLLIGIAACALYIGFPKGTLKVVNAEDGPYIFLEINKNEGNVLNKRMVLLRIESDQHAQE
jgi:hypothetical protein